MKLMESESQKEKQQKFFAELISVEDLNELLYARKIDRGLLVARKDYAKFDNKYIATRNIIDMCISLGVRQDRRQTMGFWLKSVGKARTENKVEEFPESKTIYFNFEEASLVFSKALGYICSLKYFDQKETLIKVGRNVAYNLFNQCDFVDVIDSYPQDSIDFIYDTIVDGKISKHFLNSNSSIRINNYKNKYLSIQQLIELCLDLCISRQQMNIFRRNVGASRVKNLAIYKRIRQAVREYLTDNYAEYYNIQEYYVFPDPQATVYINFEIAAKTLFDSLYFLPEMKDVSEDSPSSKLIKNSEVGNFLVLANNIIVDIARSCNFINVIKELPDKYKPERKTRRVLRDDNRNAKQKQDKFRSKN